MRPDRVIAFGGLGWLRTLGVEAAAFLIIGALVGAGVLLLFRKHVSETRFPVVRRRRELRDRMDRMLKGVR